MFTVFRRVLAVGSVVGASAVFAQPGWSVPAPGPHAVGYRRIESADVRVHVWYPAAGSGAALQFRDYVAPRVNELTDFLRGARIPDTTVTRLLDATMRARMNASPRSEESPVVLIAQGNGQDAADQAALAEFIASHGFVVITTPSPTLRIPLEREDQIGAIAALQGTELRAAMDRVPAAVSINRAKIGIVGHSFGARAALFLAMRDTAIRAVVSLDGGIGTATGVAPMRAATWFRADAVLPPLLHLFERLDAFMTPDFALIRGLRFRSIDTVEMRGMRHTHFTTYGSVVGALPELGAVTRADSATAASVERTYRRTVDFLKQHLGVQSNRD